MGLLKFELLGNERLALNQCVHECGNRIIFFLCGGGDFIGQVLIGKPKGTAQAVTDQMFGKPTGKIILPLSDQIAHFKIVGKRRALVEFSGWIDIIGFLSVFVFGPPFAGGGKVFQPKPDRVDLAVTTGALRFLLVSEDPLPSGQGFVGQAGQLGYVGWGRAGGGGSFRR